MSSIRELTHYQKQILQLAAEGWTDKAIAQFLNKTPNAIMGAINKVYNKLGLSDPTWNKNPRVLACLMYYKHKEEKPNVDTQS